MVKLKTGSFFFCKYKTRLFEMILNVYVNEIKASIPHINKPFPSTEIVRKTKFAIILIFITNCLP